MTESEYAQLIEDDPEMTFEFAEDCDDDCENCELAECPFDEDADEDEE